jgi:hypothetical protein
MAPAAYSAARTLARTPALWRFLYGRQGPIKSRRLRSGFNPVLLGMRTRRSVSPRRSPRFRNRKKRKTPIVRQCSERRVVTSQVRNNACSNSTAEAEPTYATERHGAGVIARQKRKSPLYSKSDAFRCGSRPAATKHPVAEHAKDPRGTQSHRRGFGTTRRLDCVEARVLPPCA